MKQFLIIILLTFSAFVHADDIKFTASAPNVVSEGEQFRLIYSVNGNPEGFHPPSLKDFNILMGPSTSSSSNISIINGKMTQKYSYTYTYILQAISEGSFNLSAAEVEIEGKTYKSNTLAIQVVKGQKPANRTRQNQGASQKIDTKDDIKLDKGDLFVKVNVNKHKVFIGEHIIATVKLYSKVANLTGLEAAKFPDFKGFLKQDIETPPLNSLTREVINGELYNTGILQKLVLFPQRTGKITIDPFSITCVLQQRQQARSRSIFDDFFGSYKNIKKEISSKPLKITVKSAPETGKPNSYSGAVGNFKLSTSIDKQKVKANDAITLQIKISGNGNIKLINAPPIQFPPDFEAYDPKINLNANNTAKGTNGVKTFEYLIIPRHAGNFTIPAIEFSYFSPSSKKYIKLRGKQFDIQVEKGDEEATTTVVSSVSKENVKFIGKDIRFIKTNKPQFTAKNSFLIGKKAFYLTYLGALIVFILIFFIGRKQIKQKQNISLQKNKKANKFAKKRLKNADAFLKSNDKTKFYEEVAKAIWGYLSDKLNIPLSNLSKDNVTETLRKKGADENLVQEFTQLIDDCEFARFAPSTGHSEMDNMYTRAMALITKLQQVLK